LTGRYQQRAGIEAVIVADPNHPEHLKGLQKSEVTFAERLQSAGYATGLIGKWHQGYVRNSEDYHPQNHGFDRFIGHHSGNIDFYSHLSQSNEHDWWHGRKKTKEDGYVTDLADAEPDRAADMLKRLKSWYADTQKNATPQLGGWLEVAE
jgi:arylsulfatase A-like enzyme